MGWAGPVGPAAAAVAKSLSDTGTEYSFEVPVPRTAYPYVHLHNLISVFR